MLQNVHRHIKPIHSRWLINDVWQLKLRDKRWIGRKKDALLRRSIDSSIWNWRQKYCHQKQLHHSGVSQAANLFAPIYEVLITDTILPPTKWHIPTNRWQSTCEQNAMQYNVTHQRWLMQHTAPNKRERATTYFIVKRKQVVEQRQ
jgi:hypothetical protein